MTELESSQYTHRVTHNVSNHEKETEIPEFTCEDPDFEANKTIITQVTQSLNQYLYLKAIKDIKNNMLPVHKHRMDRLFGRNQFKV